MLGLAVLTSLGLAAPGDAAPARPDPWFDIPDGWHAADADPAAPTTRLVPDRDRADLWIAVIGPMPWAGNQGDLRFSEWFELLQEPGTIVKTSAVRPGRDAAGRDVLTRVVELSDEYPPLRVYHGVRDGDRAVMFLLMAPSFRLARRNMDTLDSLASSARWGATAARGP
jgi:hypothetical protein